VGFHVSIATTVCRPLAIICPTFLTTKTKCAVSSTYERSQSEVGMETWNPTTTNEWKGILGKILGTASRILGVGNWKNNFASVPHPLCGCAKHNPAPLPLGVPQGGVNHPQAELRLWQESSTWQWVKHSTRATSDQRPGFAICDDLFKVRRNENGMGVIDFCCTYKFCPGYFEDHWLFCFWGGDMSVVCIVIFFIFVSLCSNLPQSVPTTEIASMWTKLGAALRVDMGCCEQ